MQGRASRKAFEPPLDLEHTPPGRSLGRGRGDMIRGNRRAPGERASALNLRLILVATGILAGSFFGALLLMNMLWPGATVPDSMPRLAEVPPLQPITRSSIVVAPAAIALNAIRDAMEAAAPRNLAGK